MSPMKSGGSPSGVRQPPMLETRKMKKIGMCSVRRRSELVWRRGRMRSMLAPVVPMKLARTAPMNRNMVLTSGVALRSPLRTMPPEMMNRAVRRRRKEE